MNFSNPAHPLNPINPISPLNPMNQSRTNSSYKKCVPTKENNYCKLTKGQAYFIGSSILIFFVLLFVWAYRELKNHKA